MLISDKDLIFLQSPSLNREESKEPTDAKVSVSLDLARELLAYLVEENFKISAILTQSHEEFSHAIEK